MPNTAYDATHALSTYAYAVEDMSPAALAAAVSGLIICGRATSAKTIDLMNPKLGITKRIAFIEIIAAETDACCRLLIIGAAPKLTPGDSYLFPLLQTVDPETGQIVHMLRPNAPILRLRDDSS